ncbi:MAG TPA: PAS domain S-box protein [Tepidisphaeraceae bacterium]|jgi:hypothetical protein|nr:PAS domain S-box protein [Tepidisphaeraceae bacterium]
MTSPDSEPQAAPPTVAAGGDTAIAPTDLLLRQSEGRFRAAFEQAPLGMVLVDLKGRVLRTNEAFCKIVGYPADYLIGNDSSRYTHPDDRQRNIDQLQRLEMAAVGSAVYEKRYVRPDGQVVWAQASLSPVRDDAGEVIGLIALVEDITERKASQDALARSEGQLRLILESVTDHAIFTTDLDGRVTSWNSGAERTFGYAEAEIVGRSETVLWTEADRQAGSDQRERDRARQQGSADDRRWHLRKDGARFFAGGVLHALRDAGGRVVGFVKLCRDETLQQVAEERLRVSAEQRRLALDAAQLGWWQMDANRNVDWDARVRAIYMEPDEEMTYQGVMARIHPEDRPRVDAAVKAAIDPVDPQPYRAEYRVRRTDGSIRWIASSGKAYFDGDGPNRRLLNFVGTAADITDRKVAEQALRASEARFRFLSELSEATRDLTDPESVMAVIARDLGQHLAVSRCAYAEVAPDQEHFTIRHDYVDGCASTTGDYVLSLFGPRAASDQREGRTLIVHDVDGELPSGEGAEMFNAIGIKAIVCCPLIRGGRLAAMMAVHQTTPRRWQQEEISLIEAVVERSWAYIERARTARALLQSEANFRLLADAMPQIVWAAQPDGTLDYYNSRWFAYIGLPAHAIAHATWDRYVHPDDLPGTYHSWKRSLTTGDDYTVEFRVRGASGEYRWFLARALPIRDADGTVVRWFGTCTDVHDQKLLQEQNERLLASERATRAELERQGQMKDDFLATLSHELRTPLNAIVGWSQILRSGTSDPSDLAEGLATIDRNARAQSQIIDDLLDMSRIISGKVRLDVQRVNLANVVNSAVETVRPAANAKGVRLVVVIDPAAGPVSGDPNRLQQVIWNLLSNALKFTPRGGRVQLVLQRVDSHVELSVVDTGIGIEPDFLPYVFDRFRQADSSTTRQFGGLGLGLSIVKQLVELHGGTVRVNSAGRDSGTTFAVSLPLTALHPETDSDAERRHPTGGPDFDRMMEACQNLTGVRVLVVDDEPDARALVKRLLDECGAQVSIASSVDAAMAEFARAVPDVLVSDIGMPNEDGYSLIRQVRAMGPAQGGNLPALALTAYARAEDRVKAIRAGYQMHVVKPVDPTELITMVASLAGRMR